MQWAGIWHVPVAGVALRQYLDELEPLPQAALAAHICPPVGVLPAHSPLLLSWSQGIPCPMSFIKIMMDLDAFALLSKLHWQPTSALLWGLFLLTALCFWPSRYVPARLLHHR